MQYVLGRKQIHKWDFNELNHKRQENKERKRKGKRKEE